MFKKIVICFCAFCIMAAGAQHAHVCVAWGAEKASVCSEESIVANGADTIAEPEIEAYCGMVYCATTEQVLYEKNPDMQLYSASVMKLVTAIIAYENLGLDTPVTVTEEAYYTPEYKLPLYVGETVTSGDLLHATLMKSSNDAAEALGIAVAGSKKAFTAKMQEKLTELGCDSTVPISASGVEFEEMTTCRDVVEFAQAAFAVKELREISGKTTYDFPQYNGAPTRSVISTNPFLKDSHGWGGASSGFNRYYEGVVAGKTGTARPRDAAMVVYYEKEGVELYAVILGSTKEERYNDIEKLLDYGVSKIKIATKINAGDAFGFAKLMGGATNRVGAAAARESKVILPAGSSEGELYTEVMPQENLKAPVAKGDKIGVINVLLAGEIVDSVDLVAVEAVEEGWFLSKYGITNKETMIGGIVIGIIILIVAAVTAAAFAVRRHKKIGRKNNV